MFHLKVITSTVRPGRKGPLVAGWVMDQVREYGQFEVELLDLAEINLPLMNEPHHPNQRKYQHEHTKNWSAKIDEADAFVFVTAEYNYNYPAPLRNALEYLVHEWGYKAAGIVSYGGVSAGTRAANSLKNDLATFKIVPLPEAVNFPFFSKNIDEDGNFGTNDLSKDACRRMLGELLKWTKGLKTIRNS